MAQSNYSKDFYAGSDFIIPGYNVHDAVKCMWNLAKISKALHPDDALPAMKLRHGPSDAEEAERRANSWDAMPFVPLTNLAAVGPETCQSQPQAISMQQLYRNAINKFWKWYGTKFWFDIMGEVAEGPLLDANGSPYYTCSVCPGTNFVGGHWQSERHFKKVQGIYPGFVSHQWDDDEEKWVDIMRSAD